MPVPEDLEVKYPLLFSYYPSLKEKIPWIPIGNFPSPVHKLESLGAYLGIQNLWIKRDDQNAKIYGGNKIRTLEFSLGEVISNKKGVIFAYGSSGSNWIVACTVYAKLKGIPIHVFMFHRPVDEARKLNIQIVAKLADKVITTNSVLKLLVHLLIEYVRNNKKEVHLMPPGGTSSVTTLGHVNAAFELKQQIVDGLLPLPDYIFCPLGTSGTVAGLVVGLRLLGLQPIVIGVRVADLIISNGVIIKWLANRTLDLIQEITRTKLDINISRKNFIIDHRFIGEGYAIATEKGNEDVDLLRAQEGILLDSTYTGKSMAALIDFVRKNEVENKTILFWNTFNSQNLSSIEQKVTS